MLAACPVSVRCVAGGLNLGQPLPNETRNAWIQLSVRPTTPNSTANSERRRVRYLRTRGSGEVDCCNLLLCRPGQEDDSALR